MRKKKENNNNIKQNAKQVALMLIKCRQLKKILQYFPSAQTFNINLKYVYKAKVRQMMVSFGLQELYQ